MASRREMSRTLKRADSHTVAELLAMHGAASVTRCIWVVEPKGVILPLAKPPHRRWQSYPAGFVRNWKFCPHCGKPIKRSRK